MSIVSKNRPIVRGMVAYLTIWPTSSIVQQTIEGKRWNSYDWKKAARFALFGGFFVAPTYYGWMRLSSTLWPGATIKAAMTKALVEQVTYAPFAVTSFFSGMAVLDGKSPAEAADQVRVKFWPTYQVAVCFWPFAQTVNYLLVPVRNQVVFVSTCSFGWSVFLAYMHQLSLLKKSHPIIRGMVAYATIWPASCVVQQTVAGKRWDTYDWGSVVRFSIYGGLFTAPTLYGWIRISTIMWPKVTVRTAVTKAIVEQLTYGPAALISFFFGMSLLHNKSLQEAKEEVELKFLPTWKVGICFWPVLQTVNFLYVAERNRVTYVSICSFVWSAFLSYMHHLQTTKQEQRGEVLL